jgi:hypothetical protein
MSVCCECCVLSGRGLCDELITRPEESYRLWCVFVCDLETSWMRRPWPPGGAVAPKTNERLPLWAWIGQSVYRLATGRTVRVSNPVGGEIFRTRPDRSWGPPSLLHNGYWLTIPGVKRSGRGVDHPPLSSAEVKETEELYLWAFVVCYRVNFTLTFTLLYATLLYFNTPSILLDGVHSESFTFYRQTVVFIACVFKFQKRGFMTFCDFFRLQSKLS